MNSQSGSPVGRAADAADLARASIVTTRLVLRPFAAQDAGKVSLLAGDFDVARMCARIPHPYPEAAAAAWIAGRAAAEAEGDLAFAITSEGRLIGSVGLSRHRAGYEIGYWLGRPWWGGGYALEAARALMDWAGGVLGAKLFTAGHFLDNPASGRILERLGFAFVGEAAYFGLARDRVDPCRRYVWPADAADASLVRARDH